MTDEHDYIPKNRGKLKTEGHYRLGVHRPPIPEGEDYFTLSEKHGRPKGPFEHGRERPYRGDVT